MTREEFISRTKPWWDEMERFKYEQAEKIYLMLMGTPKTHAEWADSFNKIGAIKRLMI